MEKYRRIILLSLKIGIGVSVAIYIAQSLHLEYAISAGTVTLLTLLASKWETLKLSVCRLATFTITAITAWMIFSHVGSVWIAYGLLLALIVFIAEVFDWRATISVNAVIAAHLVTTQDFSDKAVWNEFLLVLIGIVIAVFLNLFNVNLTHKRQIGVNMRHTENKLQTIIRELAAYISGNETPQNVWEDICELENQIQNFIKDAEEYSKNTFHSHPEYYVDYFQMRYEQCRILYSLHYEMKKIHDMSKQINMIAEYLQYLTDYIIEINMPNQQIEKLNMIFTDMKNEELPKTKNELESKVILFHILMVIEDFIACKVRFVNKLDEDMLKKYFN